MKIEIDTKKDSEDDIKKTIDFLLKFISHSSNLEENDTPTIGDGTFNLFDNSSTSEYDDGDKEETPSVSIVEY